MLAGWAALDPGRMAWVYLAGAIAYEFWLARRVAAVGASPVAVGEPPYGFSEDEARLVGRYRFYFTYPALARDASATLAALGLASLLLAPWLTYKQAFVQAALIGANLFAVARFTRIVVPLMALRVAANTGDRDALRMLELHDPAWEKVRAGNKMTP